MATTKDWSTTSGVGLAANGPTSTAYFAGGDATDWCVHTPPVWAKRVTIINHGTAVLYAAKPALSGSAAGAATAHALRVEASASGDPVTGSSVTLSLVNNSGTSGAGLARTFSTFGTDGAAHKMRFIFDHGYGGA